VVPYLIGGLALAFLVVLTIGGLTGRVRVQGCCSVADPSRDLRMRMPDSAEAPATAPHDQ
jgi:hypothetical protein